MSRLKPACAAPRKATVRLGVILPIAVFGTAHAAQGQQSPSSSAIAPVSQPVVQSLPRTDNLSLNAALARLGRNPRDLEALIDAGNAALSMGDVDAAVGFFGRADQISPGNPRVKAGLAGSLVRSENPFEAIPMFDAAEREGAPLSSLAADRGLAYDLVGDNATAQRFYRQALNGENSEEATRRLALSLAIARDRAGSEAALSPLLTRQDKSAWRTRAFALAILGQQEEAVSIAYATLPKELAASISPYLRYMPRLTPAQQAAAANFGHFPRAAEIGVDDPRVAAFAKARPALASADSTLIPRGEPLGRGRNQRNARAERTAAAVPAAPPPRAAPPEPPKSGREDSSEHGPATRTITAAAPQIPAAAPPRVAAALIAPPQPAPAVPAPAVPAVKAPVATAAVTVVSAIPVPAPLHPAGMPRETSASGTSDPGFDLAQIPATTPSVAASMPAAPAPQVITPAPQVMTPAPQVITPAPQALTAPPPVPASNRPSSVPPPARSRNLAEAFSEFAAVPSDVAPAAGAVDMRRITPARPAPDPRAAAVAKPGAAKLPPAPSHPSRIWVQVATGRDTSALGYDWRRISRSAADACRGKKPWISAWGQTNRLLVGPFESEAATNVFMAQLRRADVTGSFVWTSPAGQVVDALAPGK